MTPPPTGNNDPMMDILSENKQKDYPKSVTGLLRLEEKRFVQGVCYLMNNIPIFI
jgi:hypothetical protein